MRTSRRNTCPLSPASTEASTTGFRDREAALPPSRPERRVRGRAAQTVGRSLLLGLVLFALAWPAAHADKVAEFQDEQVFPNEIPEGKALIYIYRPQANVSPSPIYLYVDDQFVGIAKGNTYAFAFVDPGRRTVWGKELKIKSTALDVEAGRTYSVRIMEARAIVHATRFSLKPVPWEKARKRIKRCTYAVPTDRGRDIGEQMGAAYWPGEVIGR